MKIVIAIIVAIAAIAAVAKSAHTSADVTMQSGLGRIAAAEAAALK